MPMPLSRFSDGWAPARSAGAHPSAIAALSLQRLNRVSCNDFLGAGCAVTSSAKCENPPSCMDLPSLEGTIRWPPGPHTPEGYTRSGITEKAMATAARVTARQRHGTCLACGGLFHWSVPGSSTGVPPTGGPSTGLVGNPPLEHPGGQKFPVGGWLALTKERSPSGGGRGHKQTRHTKTLSTIFYSQALGPK